MFSGTILARGPWRIDQVQSLWLRDHYQPGPELEHAADRAIAALEKRGSPAHDGLSARLADYSHSGDKLELVLQPARWSLRLVQSAADALTVLAVVRNSDGLWLAGRRSGWVATWPGRWTLGAGGSVELGEDPAQTLTRELLEEWSVAPERMTVEALVALPRGVVMLVGYAWLRAGAEIIHDAEHDEYAWWPADIEQWPPEAADVGVRQLARMLANE